MSAADLLAAILLLPPVEQERLLMALHNHLHSPTYHPFSDATPLTESLCLPGR